jgi:hypothetical protein
LSRLRELTEDPRLTKGWFALLILFTLGVGALTLSGYTTLPSYVALVFYSFVPGYSFVEALLGRTVWFEKFFTSIFFSIAFLMGIKALDRILSLQSNRSVTFLPSSPFEFGLVFSITTVVLVFLVWRAFRPPNPPLPRIEESKPNIAQQTG